MNFNTKKTESNNKFNNIDDNKKRRGRPKNDIGIARPSTKKRGRPRKNPEKPPKPVGRNGRPKTTKEILEEEAIAKKQAKEQEKLVRQEALTAKQIEDKLKRERKIRSRIERKRMQSDEYSEYYFGAPREGHNFFTVKRLLLFLLIVAFASSSFIVVGWYKRTTLTERKMKELASKVVLIDTKEGSSESSFRYTINFQELKSMNADAVAYIIIEGTDIKYPVMQTTNNEYYLSHDIDKKSNECGAIYMDYQNDKRVTDKNTVIYGHNLKNGKMFADIEKIASGELGNDVNIEIYTPEKSMRFKVFSAYTTIPEEFSVNTEITEKDYDQYVERLKSKSEKEFVGKPEKSNQIISLSTCDKTGNQRVLVHAELEDIE